MIIPQDLPSDRYVIHVVGEGFDYRAVVDYADDSDAYMNRYLHCVQIEAFGQFDTGDNYYTDEGMCGYRDNIGFDIRYIVSIEKFDWIGVI